MYQTALRLPESGVAHSIAAADEKQHAPRTILHMVKHTFTTTTCHMPCQPARTSIVRHGLWCDKISKDEGTADTNKYRQHERHQPSKIRTNAHIADEMT